MHIVAITFPQSENPEDSITEYFGPFENSEEAEDFMRAVENVTGEQGWSFLITPLDSPIKTLAAFTQRARSLG
jgi:hypothetical protein